MRGTAAVAPNRSLYVRHSSESVVIVGSATLSNCTHCPNRLLFHFVVDLYSLFGTQYFVDNALGTGNQQVDYFFHHIVGLYSLFKSLLFSTALSGCNFHYTVDADINLSN
jgi:hypothetical protein